MTNALTPHAPQGSALAAEERQAFTALLTRQARLYAPDSSSLPAETVGELALGIEYTVSLGRSTTPSLPVAQAYIQGQAAIKNEVRRARILAAAVEKGRLPIENIAYLQTIMNLKGFFKAYDPRFFPHDVPCDIDYPTALPIESWRGVTSFTLYLRRLAMENTICSHFPPAAHRALLFAHWPFWQEVLNNITEPLLLCAAGLCALQLPPYGLSLSTGDVARLSLLFTGPKAATALPQAAAALARALTLGEECSTYLTAVLAALGPALLHAAKANDLRAFFPVGPG